MRLKQWMKRIKIEILFGRRKYILGSKYLCLECGEIYDSDWLFKRIRSEYIQCPKTNCVGTLFEVDELLLPTIKILNEKGYSTKFCCSGHAKDPRLYEMYNKKIMLNMKIAI